MNIGGIIRGHLTHPQHPLVEFGSPADPNFFLCDGCKMYGKGKRFRCEMCNFDLHEYCATCPTTLSSFLHEGPGHQLKLVLRRPPLPGQDANRICNICNIRIDGFFYQCESCEFDVHPGCNRLPQQVNHTIDQNHPLTLQKLSSGQCFVCHGACSGWRYRCSLCHVDIHFPCLLNRYGIPPPSAYTAPPGGANRSVWSPSMMSIVISTIFHIASGVIFGQFSF